MLSDCINYATENNNINIKHQTIEAEKRAIQFHFDKMNLLPDLHFDGMKIAHTVANANKLNF
jgi:hypothetical protein